MSCLKKFVFSALTAGVLLAGGPAVAQNCNGEPGYVLSNAPLWEVGTGRIFTVEAPPSSIALVFASLGEGPTNSPFGTFCLDFPVVFSTIKFVPASGVTAFLCAIPCDSNLVGITSYWQFLAAPRGDFSQAKISNQTSITIVDGDCRQFCSFTPGGWGQPCNGMNVGCLRDSQFDSVFPSGLVLGDQDGVDGDGLYALVLTSASAIEQFLPQGTGPGTLDQDATNPLVSSAGSFSSSLAAAKLNVAFDDAGLFEPSRTDVYLGDLVFHDCVDEDLIGHSVREVIAWADDVISGAYGACTDGGSCRGLDVVDADGDGTPDVSLSDLHTALDTLNNNYDDCALDNGCLRIQL